jgi:hypothetical protein
VAGGAVRPLVCVAMQLRPEALRFVLAQGLPATIEVVGASMEPTIARGAKIMVVAWPQGGERVGEIVLLATEGTGGVLLLHRVMHLFEEAGHAYVVHQGDAPGSEFAIVPREAVLGRMRSFAAPDARLSPTPERLDDAARARFGRRRAACLVLVAARRTMRVFGLAERPFARALGQRFRALARRVLG